MVTWPVIEWSQNEMKLFVWLIYYRRLNLESISLTYWKWNEIFFANYLLCCILLSLCYWIFVSTFHFRSKVNHVLCRVKSVRFYCTGHVMQMTKAVPFLLMHFTIKSTKRCCGTYTCQPDLIRILMSKWKLGGVFLKLISQMYLSGCLSPSDLNHFCLVLSFKVSCLFVA